MPQTQPAMTFRKTFSAYVIALQGGYLGLAEDGVEFGEIDSAQCFTPEEVESLKSPSAIAKPGTPLQSDLLLAEFKKVQVTMIYLVEK